MTFELNDAVHLFDQYVVYGDLCSNCHGSAKTYDELVQGLESIGVVPKLQLFSDETFNREWALPSVYAASVFRQGDIDWLMSQEHLPLALKISSVESTHFELIKLSLATKLPVIISTGGIDEQELLTLFELVQEYEHGVCLMHCVSAYPTPPEQANILRLRLLGEYLDDMLMIPWLGWSCHTPLEYQRPLIAALALGATQLEFHIMPNSHKHGGTPQDPLRSTPDEQSSLDLRNIKYVMNIVDATRAVLGNGLLEQSDRPAVLEWRARWKK